MQIKLQEQPFRVLLELVANPGKIVSREELQQKLWPADTFVDFDVGLNTAIRKLRQALGDAADHPHYIETLSKRGYRFVAAVTDTTAPADVVVVPVTDTAPGLRPSGEEARNGNSHPIRLWLAVAGGVLAVAATVYAWWMHRPPPPSPNGQGPVEINPLTETGNVFQAAASRDGSYIAYVQSDAGKFDLRLLQVATGRIIQLLPDSPLATISLHFSPDGNFIYFLRQIENPDGLGVFRIATLGGPETRLATDAQMRSVTVSPDGKLIAYISQTPSESLIVAVDSEGAGRRVLAQRPASFGFRYIEWSPSQETMAAVALSKGMRIGLFSVDLSSGAIRDVSVSGWGTIGQPAWSPDGDKIYAPAVPAERLMPMMHIWEFNALTGDHSPVTSGSTQYRLSTLSATATGTLIANTKAFSLTLWATDAAGKAQQIPSTRSEGWDGVAWVGNRIVTDTLVGMVRHDADGSNATELRSQSNIYRALARCGPESVVYWAFDAKRKSHIARTNITTAATSALTDGPSDGEPTCTPDGSILVFVHCAELSNRCFLTRKSLDTGETLNLYEWNANDEMAGSPAVSPDGSSVLFTKQPEAGDPNGWAMTIPINGGEPKKLKMAFPDADSVRWAPDGKGFYYVRTKNGVGNVWSAPLEGKPVTQLTDFNSDKIFSFDVSTDKRLVIARGTMTSDIVLIKMTR